MPDLQQAAREAADLTEHAVSLVRGRASSVGDTMMDTAGDLLSQARPGHKRRRRPPWPVALAVVVLVAWLAARRARRPEPLQAVRP